MFSQMLLREIFVFLFDQRYSFHGYQYELAFDNAKQKY